jgi:hypothetical protein
MLQFILRLWQRIKPWVERAEHAELIFGKTGFGAFLWKWIYPVVAITTAAIVWLWAWWDQAPGYWRFVAALIALLSALALVYFFLMTLDWFRARRLPRNEIPKGRKAAAQQRQIADLQPPSAIRRHYEKEDRERLSVIFHNLYDLLNERVSPAQLAVHEMLRAVPYRIQAEGSEPIKQRLWELRTVFFTVRNQLIEQFMQGDHYYADEIQDITSNEDPLNAEIVSLDNYLAVLDAIAETTPEKLTMLLDPHHAVVRDANFELGNWVGQCNERIKAKRNELQ